MTHFGCAASEVHPPKIAQNSHKKTWVMWQRYTQSAGCSCNATYIPLSDDKHQMVRDGSKKNTGQYRHNSNPVAMLQHAAVVFHMEPFNCCFVNK